MVANETGGTQTPASTRNRRAFLHNQDPMPTFDLDGLPHGTTPASCLSRVFPCRDYAG
jgi:hypothetical protein